MRRPGPAHGFFEEVDRQRAALGWSWPGLLRMTARHTVSGEPVPWRAVEGLRTDRRPPPAEVVYAVADAAGIDRALAASLAGIAPSPAGGSAVGTIIVLDGLSDPQRDLLHALVEQMVRANG